MAHGGWSSERSVSAAAEPPRGPPRPHGSARPHGRLARAALWCAEPRLTPGSSATQDHHTRVPRAVSGCRCAARELNRRAPAPHDRAQDRLSLHAAPLGCCCRGDRGRRAHREGACGTCDGRRSPVKPRLREPPLKTLARSRGLGRSGPAPAPQRPWHAATCEGGCEGGWCGVSAALLVRVHDSRGFRCRLARRVCFCVVLGGNAASCAVWLCEVEAPWPAGRQRRYYRVELVLGSCPSLSRGVVGE